MRYASWHVHYKKSRFKFLCAYDECNLTTLILRLLEPIEVPRMVDIDILMEIWKNRVKKIDFVLKWLSRVGLEVGPTKGFCEGDTRNRWRDGQVCPDVDKELWRLGPDGSGVFWRWTSVSRCGQGTMAPWARRLGCVLACYAPIGRGRSRETLKEKKRGEKGQESPGERTDGNGGGKTEKKERRRIETERESGGERTNPALNGEKGLSPEIGVKKTMNAGGVENGNKN
ncbi:hypothetical protein TNCV_4558301 [Trichonephila clavipes]|nr:hypothetical protein TNCV_4558301 [Trichonephila clavipes]